MSRGRQLAVLTAAKWVSNVALRWPSVFLPNLERAFHTSTGTLTSVMGVGELGGLTTLLTGRWLDRGHERRVFVAGVLAVAASSLIALGGSTWTFAIAFAVLIVGVGNLTVAGHAWISHRFGFTERGRAIGAFETSWAFSMLVGAPLVALLLRGVGWRAPFTVLALAAFVAAAVVARFVSVSPAPPADSGSLPARLARGAYPPMIASAATAAAGLGLFVVSGAWLGDRHGVSTGGLGAIAAAYGVVELASSSSVALVSDRVGARRSVLLGLAALLAGCGVIAVSGGSRALAIAGLLVFLAGFEYGFVSSLTLVTEAAPDARGRAIGISNAMGTLARSGSVVLSGQLYEAFGVRGSLAWVTAAAATAAAFTAVPAGTRGSTRRSTRGAC